MNKEGSGTNTTATQTKGSKDRKLTNFAQSKLEGAATVFGYFIRDNSGLLTEIQIPSVLGELYSEMGQTNRLPSKQEIQNFVQEVDKNPNRIVDRNSERLFTLDQFKQIFLLSLEKSGFNVYE